MTPGEEFIRTTLQTVGCTSERIDEALADVKTAVRLSVPRIELCVDCQVFVSDWVEASESPAGRICRPCETLRSLRQTQTPTPRPAAAENWHPFIAPFHYDEQAQFIQDAENHLLLDIRGWGFLTGQGTGGLGLNDVDALALQDQIGRRITGLLNSGPRAHLNGIDVLGALRRGHLERMREWCPDPNNQADLSFRGNELAGETGEACNVIKKLERERHGWAGSRDTVEHLASELADVVIVSDMIAEKAGFDLGEAVVAKFNATSEKHGFKTRIESVANK